MEKKYPLTSFSKEIFSIYFEHNRNSIEETHELKIIMSLKFFILETRSIKVIKAIKCLSTFKIMFPLVLKVLKKFYLAFLSH